MNTIWTFPRRSFNDQNPKYDIECTLNGRALAICCQIGPTRSSSEKTIKARLYDNDHRRNDTSERKMQWGESIAQLILFPLRRKQCNRYVASQPHGLFHKKNGPDSRRRQFWWHVCSLITRTSVEIAPCRLFYPLHAEVRDRFSGCVDQIVAREKWCRHNKHVLRVGN